MLVARADAPPLLDTSHGVAASGRVRIVTLTGSALKHRSGTISGVRLTTEVEEEIPVDHEVYALAAELQFATVVETFKKR
jgi:hypothetical protein